MSSSSDGDPAAGNLIGVKVIVPGDNPTVDIVFVHGLEGNPFKTWTYKEKGKPDVYWPKDLLAQEIPEARILAYGYDTSVTAFFDKASTNMIHHHAMTMVSRLQLFRSRRINGQSASERPIIWVCHSLGGILVKRALIYSQSCGVGHNEKLRSIMVSTQGIVFLATPHMGSSAAAWGAMAHKFIGAFMPGIDKNNTLLKTLESDSETLQNITALFAGISQQFDIIFFYEELKTHVAGKQLMIVDHTSAVLTALPNTQQVGIHATHQGICKYKDENSPGYADVAGILREYVERAEKYTPVRWKAEKQRSVLATHEEIDKRWIGTGLDPYVIRSLAESSSNPQGGSTSRDPSPAPFQKMLEGKSERQNGQLVPSDRSPKLLLPHEHDPKMCLPPSMPPFVVPYTQNQSPVRRHYILTRMDTILQNKEILEHGHTSLLLWGPPGSGKTHLIREYVFTRRGKFPGGIFWVKAKNREDRNAHFRRICQELRLTKDDEDESEGNAKPQILAIFGGNESSMEKVVNWLKRRINWLLIIDGANVDTEDEIDDLKKLIPGGTGGSIIFTSLNKNLINYARLGPPASFEIPQMKQEEGVHLLLSEAGLLPDPTTEEVKVATNLVELMEYLPLAIHLAANYIAESGVSIHAYYREYKEHPKVSGRGWSSTLGMTIKTLRAKHIEAANLLNLISFFSGDIPVELLKWGLEALPKSIKIIAKEEDGTRDFHLTVKHLLSFSLVRRSHERETDVGDREWRVDRLHVQTVVQSFCRQQLGNEQGKIWAQYACNVFCYAFDLAERVRGHDGPIFVKDYETFISHGSFLLERIRALGMSRKTLKAKLNRAREVKEAQIEAQTKAVDEGKEIPLPRRSIFGRADSESPINTRTSTFGSTSSTTTTSDEHEHTSNDASSLKWSSNPADHGRTDDSLSSEYSGGDSSSRGEFNGSQAGWTEVRRKRPPARTFSTGSGSSTGYSRGSYTRQRYPRRSGASRYPSNQTRSDRRRNSGNDHAGGFRQDRSQSMGPETPMRSYPGRGRGTTRYSDSPQLYPNAHHSRSRMNSRDRQSPSRVNPSSVVGPRDPSPRHPQRELEYQAPPRANISDRLSPARGPLYSDVARGGREGRRSDGHSRHSSRESSRRRVGRSNEVEAEPTSRDSSRSTQSWATVMPATEMVRSSSHPSSEPPRVASEWPSPRQGSGRGSGSGSRRGSVESTMGRPGHSTSRHNSPMDPQRVRPNWQDIPPPPPLPVEPAYTSHDMVRNRSAPAATYTTASDVYYAEQNASVRMPIAPPLFPMGELTVGAESYVPRSSATYALARGQVPVQLPVQQAPVQMPLVSGPPGFFIPLAQATATPTTVLLPPRSAPPSVTSSFPVRYQNLPSRPDNLNPISSHYSEIRRNSRSPIRERRGSLPGSINGTAPSVLSDPSEVPPYWDVTTAPIAASEPELGRNTRESSPPPPVPVITQWLPTETSDFAGMGSQFESDLELNGQMSALSVAATLPQAATKEPSEEPKLAKTDTGLSNASVNGSLSKAPALPSPKKSEESVIDRFSKNVVQAWRSATEPKKKIVEPSTPGTPESSSSTKLEAAVKRNSPVGWMKFEKKKQQTGS